MKDRAFVHTVHTVFHMHATHEMMREILKKFETLGEECGGKEKGILFWKVGMNLTRPKKGESPLSRKIVHMVQFAIFLDDASFQKFREHPAHVALKKKLTMHADWASGDLPLSAKDFEALHTLSRS